MVYFCNIKYPFYLRLNSGSRKELLSCVEGPSVKESVEDVFLSQGLIDCCLDVTGRLLTQRDPYFKAKSLYLEERAVDDSQSIPIQVQIVSIVFVRRSVSHCSAPSNFKCKFTD